MATSIRSKVIVAVTTSLVVLVVAAILFPVFSRAKESSGPSITGGAVAIRTMMAKHYGNRPSKIAAWSSQSGPPPWMSEMETSSIGRGGWKVLTRRLRTEKAELSIAPNAVGRRWDDLRENEAVLVVTFREKPALEIPKFSRSYLYRPRIEAGSTPSSALSPEGAGT